MRGEGVSLASPSKESGSLFVFIVYLMTYQLGFLNSFQLSLVFVQETLYLTFFLPYHKIDHCSISHIEGGTYFVLEFFLLNDVCGVFIYDNKSIMELFKRDDTYDRNTRREKPCCFAFVGSEGVICVK